MNNVNVHCSWDPLEEIWLGDVWPENFYDDLDPEIRDSFKLITQWTKEDLNSIQKKLEEFNVKVLRPNVEENKTSYTIMMGKQLKKPPICPRDTNGVVGDKLFSNHKNDICYRKLLKQYNNVYYPSHEVPFVSGASCVKLGKDLIFDFIATGNKDSIFQHYHNFKKTYGDFFSDYRLHYSTNGGHIDGCFMPVKPGLVLATRYWKDYDLTFPGWEKIHISHPSYITAGKDYKGNGHNGNWITMVKSLPPHFNKFVYQKCKDWVGNYKETYFEVNVVMIDQNNMLCIDSAKANEPIYEALDKQGVKCHVVPWRTRGFWDGGLHCITLDVKRKSSLEDYFPNRGHAGIKTIMSNRISSSQDDFLSKYENWLKLKNLRE